MQFALTSDTQWPDINSISCLLGIYPIPVGLPSLYMLDMDFNFLPKDQAWPK